MDKNVLTRIVRVQPELERYFKYQDYQIELLRKILEEKDEYLERSNNIINMLEIYLLDKIQDLKVNINLNIIHREIEKNKELNIYLKCYNEILEVIKSE